MLLSRYICLFMIYSFMGWVYETAFCTIKNGKWENRGFLYGPVCPIYGTGAVAISIIMSLTMDNSITLAAWQVFLISVFGSAILEYTTSWTMEKLFHAVWWDYSDLPLNVNGRISLFTSLGFGIAGLLIVYYIAPFTVTVVSKLPMLMIELLALIFVFVFAADLTLTVSILHHFDRMVAHFDDSFNQRMTAVVDTTVQQSNRIKETIMNNGHLLNERINSLGSFVRGAIRRIYSFRDKNEQSKVLKNNLLLVIRRFTRRRKDPESKDQD